MESIRNIVDSAIHAFKDKMYELCVNFDLSELRQELAEQMSCCLKQALSAAGAAAYHRYIESFDVDKPSIVDEQGQLLRNKGKVGKYYLTPFGEVHIERCLYQADRGGPGFVPLESAWGMRGHYATVEVRESIAYAAAHCTPQETRELMRRCALFEPSATAVKHIITKVGTVVENHRDVIAEQVLSAEHIPSQAEVLAVSMDGANVLLRERGSRCRRPAQRPAADAAQHDVAATYRNAMVGTLSFYQADPGTQKPQRICTRYVSRMPQEGAVEFKRDMEREVAHLLNQPQSAPLCKVLLLDGSRSLWNYVEHNPLYQHFDHFVVDFYHATEHLSRAAEALFGKSSEQGNRWYEKWKDKLKHKEGAVQGLLRSIHYHQATRKISYNRRQALTVERTFFTRNQHRMCYAQLHAQGMPIGSGPVEAACKSLVKARLCRSGMRWSREGGQHVLALRTFVKSNRWENAWQGYRNLAQAA